QRRRYPLAVVLQQRFWGVQRAAPSRGIRSAALDYQRTLGDAVNRPDDRVVDRRRPNGDPARRAEADSRRVLRGRRHRRCRGLALYVFESAFNFYRMGYGSAMSWILFLIIVVYSPIQYRVLRMNRNRSNWLIEIVVALAAILFMLPVVLIFLTAFKPEREIL